jgi:adenosylhomocysteine nucleosidase
MKRVGIVAALPGELKPLVQGWRPLTLARKGEAAWVSRVHDVECVAVYAGVGSEAAGRACDIAAQSGEAAQSRGLDALFSVGWAGALSCGIHPGSAYAVNEVVDAQTGETFVTSFPLNQDIGVPFKLVTTDHIVQYAEKRQLAGLHKAVLVDMEAATVARFARSRQIPFYCLKAISDEISDILPDFGRYTAPDGHLRIAPLLGHVAFRPKYWPAMLRMGQNAKSGARAVAGALAPLMSEG